MTEASSDDTSERPAGVPAATWRSPKGPEWVLGPKDADGELHGEVRHWRADGTLCSVSHRRHGQPHGSFERFHATGEISQTGSYEAGKLHGLRTFFAASHGLDAA